MRTNVRDPPESRSGLNPWRVGELPPAPRPHGLGWFSAVGALAQAVATQKGAMFGGAIAILGVWILFKTQLDILEGMTRAITDILWTGSTRIRALARR